MAVPPSGPGSSATPVDPLIMLLQACAVVDKGEGEKDVTSFAPRIIPPNLTPLELASLNTRDLRNLLLPYAPYKLLPSQRTTRRHATPHPKMKPRHRITPRWRRPPRAPDARATHDCFMRTLSRLSFMGAASAAATA